MVVVHGNFSTLLRNLFNHAVHIGKSHKNAMVVPIILLQNFSYENKLTYSTVPSFFGTQALTNHYYLLARQMSVALLLVVCQSRLMRKKTENSIIQSVVDFKKEVNGRWRRLLVRILNVAKEHVVSFVLENLKYRLRQPGIELDSILSQSPCPPKGRQDI